MKKNKTTKKMIIKKGIKFCAFFAIALILVYATSIIDSKADSNKKVPEGQFLYSKFSWNDFYDKNKAHWDGMCKEDNGDVDTKCLYKTINSQKKFYKKLYKTLAKYEKRGVFDPNTEVYQVLDDLVLETVFFELLPSQFSDDSNEYREYYSSGKGTYAIDDADLEDPEIDINIKDESELDYYATEKDTVKVLVNNLVAYTTDCYGVYGDPTKHVSTDGVEYYTCDEGGEPVELPVRGKKCVAQLQSGSELGFWEFFLSKAQHDESINAISKGLVRLFLGKAVVDKYYETCKALGEGYSEKSMYVYNDTPKVSTNRYFDFLRENRYFDSRPHLQGRFKDKILDPAGVKCMTSEICDNSLEATGNYDEWEAQAMEIRLEIIENLISIIKNYGFDISYGPAEPNSYSLADEQEAARKSFYWPIGSDETEERNGVIYADKDPASTEVISGFGERENPVTKQYEFHYGIDIKGVEGVTNVVSVYPGNVLEVVSSCSVGDTDCNEGYGNMIIISHSNNDYTVYAHLDSIDPSVTVGATVDKGQLIGKVGKTGQTVEACLHYEVRKGGNAVGNALNPVNVTSPDNPRPMVAAGDFSVHQTSLTKEEFVSKFRNYCSTHNCNGALGTVFLANAESVYDTSIAANVNPELVIIRAVKEGMSPGGSTNNYWGISCYNGAGAKACSSYSSLQDGIRGFAKVVSSYDTVSQMMGRYAYIGKVWYNPGSWSNGGCIYLPYINQYMSEQRRAETSRICSGSACSGPGDPGCTATTDEDQYAYSMFNSSKMIELRYIMFGL